MKMFQTKEKKLAKLIEEYGACKCGARYMEYWKAGRRPRSREEEMLICTECNNAMNKLKFFEFRNKVIKEKIEFKLPFTELKFYNQ